MNKKLLILGAKGTAKMAIEAMEGQNTYSEIALLDTFADYDALFSYPIIGKCDDLEQFREKYTHAFVCIGDNKVRTGFLQRLRAAGFKIPNIIHPSAHISKSASIGTGVFVNVNAVIQAGCKIGDGCFIQSGAVVEHDNELGECVNIGPNASTTGDVTIGGNTFVGACSCIINGVHIGANVIVAAGSAVISDIPDNVMIAGSPAKIKKHI